jgi:hypothetical protein
MANSADRVQRDTMAGHGADEALLQQERTGVPAPQQQVSGSPYWNQQTIGIPGVDSQIVWLAGVIKTGQAREW